MIDTSGVSELQAYTDFKVWIDAFHKHTKLLGWGSDAFDLSKRMFDMGQGSLDQLYLDMTTFPNQQSLDALRGVGVSYVVVHTNEFGSRWRAVEETIGRTPTLKLAHVEGDGRVYALLPP